MIGFFDFTTYERVERFGKLSAHYSDQNLRFCGDASYSIRLKPELLLDIAEVMLKAFDSEAYIDFYYGDSFYLYVEVDVSESGSSKVYDRYNIGFNYGTTSYVVTLTNNGIEKFAYYLIDCVREELKE